MKLKRYRIFEAKLEQAVEELKEDVLLVFEGELKKFRVPKEAIDGLFDTIQTEFDKGEEPEHYIVYKEGGTNLILSYTTATGKDIEIFGKVFGIYESYGPAHAEICCAIDIKEFGFLHDKSYKSKKIPEQLISKKIEALEKELLIWKNIK